MTKNLTLIAIDPGYDRVGWAIAEVQGQTILQLRQGLIQTHRNDTLIERYRTIDQQLQEILAEYKPQEAAVETLFFSVNKTTAMRVAEARGVILSALLRSNVKIAEYNPMQIKQAVTGYGQADKKAVEKMVRLQLKPFLPLPQTKQLIDDTLDALGLLLTHLTSRKMLAK